MVSLEENNLKSINAISDQLQCVSCVNGLKARKRERVKNRKLKNYNYSTLRRKINIKKYYFTLCATCHLQYQNFPYSNRTYHQTYLGPHIRFKRIA